MKLIVANWKMNPATLREALELAKACDHEGVVLCVPFPYVLPLKQVLKFAKLGAQNVASCDSGPYTGEVSPLMLKDVGCEYVIIGHSERRRTYGETDVIVHQKLAAALRVGLTPILCITDPSQAEDAPCITYEPEEAISTQAGRVPSLQDIATACASIHGRVSKAMVLYGGNVNANNAKDILALPSVDGVLVGAAIERLQSFNKN